MAIGRIYVCLLDDDVVMDNIDSNPIGVMVSNKMTRHDDKIKSIRLWLLNKYVLIMIFHSLRLRNFYVKILLVKTNKIFVVG